MYINCEMEVVWCFNVIHFKRELFLTCATCIQKALFITKILCAPFILKVLSITTTLFTRPYYFIFFPLKKLELNLWVFLLLFAKYFPLFREKTLFQYQSIWLDILWFLSLNLTILILRVLGYLILVPLITWHLILNVFFLLKFCILLL